MLPWLGAALIMAASVAVALVRVASAPSPTKMAHAPTRMDVVVGPNVLVSKSPADVPQSAYTATFLVADPKEHLRLLAGTILNRSSGRLEVIVYASTDGGRTWKASLEHQDAADPALAFGPNGGAYFICSDSVDNTKQPVEEPNGLHFFHSLDGGSHWDKGVPWRFPAYHGIDRCWVTADCTGGRFNGRVYASFHATATPLLGTSEGGIMQAIPLLASDDGKTFAPSTAGNTRFSHGPGGVIGGPGVVLSDGTYVTSYITEIGTGYGFTGETPFKICVARSVDGGASFGISDTGAPDMSMVGVFREAYSRTFLCDLSPFLACDPGSARFKDRLYLVWNDFKEGEGGRVMLSSSQDKGRIWARPVVISDIPPQLRATKRGYAGTPCVAVNKDGVVGVTWYDTRHLPAGSAGGWDVHFTASADGGATWSPSMRVSETSSLLENSRENNGPDITPRGGMGDTGGLAADANGVFHLLWLDNRTGTRQLWTATVTVKPEQKN